MSEFPDSVYAHQCGEESCNNFYLSKSEETPTGVKCAGRKHFGNYRFDGETREYRQSDNDE